MRRTRPARRRGSNGFRAIAAALQWTMRRRPRLFLTSFPAFDDECADFFTPRRLAPT